MRNFLQYWKVEQADLAAGRPLTHSGSAQFNRLRPGDVVWVVSTRDGRLKLLGRIFVSEVISHTKATRRFGDLYEAPLHIIADPDTVREVSETDIQGIASRFRFNSKRDRLMLNNPSKTDGKQLQALRELSTESVKLLAEAIGEPVEQFIVEIYDSHTLRNPPWTRDELILALDLYFRHHPNTIKQTHEAVENLSTALNLMGRRLGRVQNDKFRNQNGVYMKMCNFLRLDPAYHGTGLKGGGKLEEEVWNRFANDREQLRQIADSILLNIADTSQSLTSFSDADEEAGFAEGAVLYRTHVSRERNRTLVRTAKERAKLRDGCLRCEACLFIFRNQYGELGGDYIECHHTIPISELKPGSKTKVEEVALLCANCHRMVHLRRPWLNISDLRELVSKSRPN